MKKIKLLKLLILFIIPFSSCNKDENGTDNNGSSEIPVVTLSPNTNTPIKEGESVTLQGSGFKEGCEIWLRETVKTKVSSKEDIKATITKLSPSSITFLAPKNVKGKNQVILKQEKKEYPLCELTFSDTSDNTSGSGSDTQKPNIIFSEFTAKNKTAYFTVTIQNNPSNVAISSIGFEVCLKQEWDQSSQDSQKGSNLKSADFKFGPITHNSDLYFRPYVYGESIGMVYGSIWIYNANTGKIISPDGTTGNNPSTDTNSHPDNVSSFNITVTPKKQLLNSLYVAPMKQWQLTIRNYSEVTFDWQCNDSKAVGIVVVQRAFTPTDGIKFTNYDAQYYSASGSFTIKQWQSRVSSIVYFYIRSFDINYNYSKEYIMKQASIGGINDYSTWSSTPYI